MYFHAWRWSYRPKHVTLLNITKLLSLTVHKIYITTELSNTTCWIPSKQHKFTSSPGGSTISNALVVGVAKLHLAIVRVSSDILLTNVRMWATLKQACLFSYLHFNGYSHVVPPRFPVVETRCSRWPTQYLSQEILYYTRKVMPSLAHREMNKCNQCLLLWHN
jgi:hypothetical protein